ncbi:3153_t:CDS:2 [Funneliformis mosseae]|uniref:3153_t:CDS:1 n=1 Tax=Funneliformis mosseae TaxID=27381 RepID=A0A9N8VP20_FUNMO|nr:3153_t:CDS:2 [Funneliformis mosseae]
MVNTNAPRKVHKLTKQRRIKRKIRSNNNKMLGKLRPSEMVIHGRHRSKKKQQKLDRLIRNQQNHGMESGKMIIEKINTEEALSTPNTKMGTIMEVDH